MPMLLYNLILLLLHLATTISEKHEGRRERGASVAGRKLMARNTGKSMKVSN